MLDLTTPPGPLRFREHRRCTVMPYRPGAARGTLEMGVLDAAGVCIPDTLIRRSYANGKEARIGLPGDFGPAAAAHAGPAIYLGPLLPHFGHFLLESLARVWLARRHPDTPVVWSCPVSEAGGLRRWQQEILELLGVRNPPLFVAAPARFDELIVPDVGYRIQHYFHPEHAAALATVPHRPAPGRRLWLSRTRLGQLQNLSMPEVESRLAERGWTVVHPEALPVRAQVAQLAAAERIAGEQGSALHGVIFLQAPRALRLDLFLRDPSRPPDLYNRNFDTIARVKGIAQRTHRMTSESILRQRGNQIEKVSSDIQEYFEKLGIGARMPGGKGRTMPQTGPARISTAAARINRLAAIRGAKRYLEIGVASGQTFLAVDIETRHGVDPAFRFDPAPHASERVRFFPMTSDRFFTEAAPRDLRYDIVFLDGLHTFEQTFRDFCASMAHAHADTVWIIDDVFPSDVFSALPSQRAARQFRQLHGLESRLWHGDVYKCVFAIHDFFPNFSYRTLRRAHGNPQTIVINRPRPDFRPAFDDLERISRLDYYGFWEHRGLLRLDSEEAIFAWLAEAL